jgi:hypothetical protein
MPGAMRVGFVVLLLVACVGVAIGLRAQVLAQEADYGFVIYEVEGPDGPRLMCGTLVRINGQSDRVIGPELTPLHTR